MRPRKIRASNFTLRTTTADIALADVRDAVLRKIGRNVVNFQKMEAMLKLLNTQQAMNGSLKDVKDTVKEAP